jgi:hypothetical protein
MDHKTNRIQRGQSLVFFAVLSVAGLIFLALIIDGGAAYAMRRLAQNAADAGALAGARQYCMTGDSAIAYTTAKDYAEQNNQARLGNVTSQVANVSVSGPYVNVVTNIIYETFFARILGMDQMTAVAEAEAGCFVPSAAEGVIPVAWECRDFDEGGYWGSDCELEYLNDLVTDPTDNSCDLGEDTVYLFIDDLSNNYACDHWPSGAQEDATILDCGGGEGTTHNKPVIELVNPYHPSHGWMWVDLNGGNSDANELKDWVQGINVPEVTAHLWLFQASGDITSVYDAIYDYHTQGDIVIIPVFDDRCKSADPEIRCWDPVSDTWDYSLDWWHDGQDVVRYISSNSDENVYSHLISFALLEIGCVDAGSHQCSNSAEHARQLIEDLNPGEISPSIKSFEGCFRRGFHPGLLGQDADGVVVGAWTIYLTK